MRYRFLYLIVFMGLLSCQKEQKSDFLFDYLDAAKSGIHFSNDLVDTEEFNIMEYLYYYNGGGVAAGDLNNDGKVDLFFTGNQVNDALYINEGNLKFKDVSEAAGFHLHNGWSTGVTMADINKDGWLDIYVCRLGKYKIYNDHNRLYINNQDGTFKESSKEYGLDFSGFSTQAAFFDYDKDGDLDCYLLNHSVKRPDQFVRSDRIRNEFDSLAGDRLYRNDGSIFKDVTSEAGIYSSSVGFGLSVCIADLNGDYSPDIYVGNDFHENDYLYLNNGDGSFKEVIGDVTGHTSNFTMGSTISDINRDGQLDIFSLDMQPNDEVVYKMSGGWESKQIYDFKRDYGYHDQSPRNALQVKIGQDHNLPVYSEQASSYNIHASDWSWTPLIKDFDLDGDQDIYITNGIYKRPNDMDFVNYFSDPQNGNKSNLELIQKMPSGEYANQFFEQENGAFTNKSNDKKTISNGACTADLDNDGDLDIITNNINEKASILINTTNPELYLKISLKGDSIKTLAKSGITIHAIDFSAEKNETITFMSSNNGFQSMNEEIALIPHFKDTLHLFVSYPNGAKGIYLADPSKRNIEIDASNLRGLTPVGRGDINLIPGDSITRHFENKYNDQNKEPLLIYNTSQLGPKMVSNREGLIYFPQAKGKNGALIDIKSEKVIQTLNKGGATQFVDETDALFFDVDGDGDQDLYVCLGGNELPDGDLSLSDMLFINEGRTYTRNMTMLPPMPFNTSTVSASDYDLDGDLDLFVGVQGRGGDYANPDVSYLLKNENGKSFKAFKLDVREMVYDSEWEDLDQDGRKDLIIAGHWMPITILYNREGGFEKHEIANSNGWWNTIEVGDFDKDGKLDIIAGNFGENHRLNVTPSTPLNLYIDDFDTNGKNDPIITYHIGDKEYPYANLDLLLKQIPGKRKQFIQHSDYAEKTIDEIFSAEELTQSIVKTTHTLASSVFFQDEAKKWTNQALPKKTQLAPVWAIEPLENSFILGGNQYDIDPNLGRQDALPLTPLKFEGREIQIPTIDGLIQSTEEVRSILSSNGRIYLGINDGPLLKQSLNK